MEIISFAPLKGGNLKTSTVLNLAGIYSKDQRILTIGLDAQRNLSNFLQQDNANHEYTIYDVLFNNVPIEDTIHQSRFDNIFYIPDSKKMGNVTSIVDKLSIKEKLQNIYDSFDVVIVDVPPVLTSSVTSAIAASTKVIINTEMDRFSLENVVDMINNITEINEDTSIFITPVKVVSNSKVHRNVKRDMENFAKDVDYLTLTESIPNTIENTNRIYDRQILTLEKGISKAHRQLKRALLKISKDVL